MVSQRMLAAPLARQDWLPSAEHGGLKSQSQDISGYVKLLIVRDDLNLSKYSAKCDQGYIQFHPRPKSPMGQM